MIEKLVKLVDGYDNDIPYKAQSWYEIDYIDCSKILEKFSDDDWNKLMTILPTKSNIWKERLVYCLNRPQNKYHVKIMAELVNTDDVNLFIKIIYVLVAHDFAFSKDTINTIIKKMDYLEAKVDDFTKNIFISYKEKLEDKIKYGDDEKKSKK